MSDPEDTLKRLTTEMEDKAKEAVDSRNRILRAEGVAAVLHAPTLISTGPDHWGPTYLYLMTDGTVRWKKDWS